MNDIRERIQHWMDHLDETAFPEEIHIDAISSKWREEFPQIVRCFSELYETRLNEEQRRQWIGRVFVPLGDSDGLLQDPPESLKEAFGEMVEGAVPDLSITFRDREAVYRDFAFFSRPMQPLVDGLSDNWRHALCSVGFESPFGWSRDIVIGYYEPSMVFRL